MDTTTFPIAVLLIPGPDDAAVTYAKGVIAGMTGNLNFTPPPPELAELAADADAYDKANVAARNKGKVEVAARRAARKQVVKTLHHVRDRIQGVAETQTSPSAAAAVIVGAGMHVKKVVTRNKPAVRASYGAVSGSVVLDALRVAAIAMYYWSFSLDQKTWTDVPQTLKARAVVSGLTPGQLYYFRFHAETRKGPVDFSQIVSLMVH